jgi:UDP-glucose 4-epimerase
MEGVNLSMRIFITGIAGFIGSALAKSLKKDGHYVTGIDNLFSGYASNIPSTIEWKKGDIRYFSELDMLVDKYDVIIHLAAQTSGEKSFEIPEYDMDTNLKGSFNVFRFTNKCKADLMINMSSMSVYGDVLHKATVDENTPPSPVSLYGSTKLAAENMLNALSKQESLPVINLRLFNAYGEGQDLSELKQGMVSIYLAHFLLHDKVTVKGSFERVRDFIYIDDIVNAIKAVIDSKQYQSNTFNLCFGEPVSVQAVLASIQQALASDKKIVQVGNTAGDVMGFAGNNEKFRETMNWQPQFSFDKGIQKMIDYYKGLK